MQTKLSIPTRTEAKLKFPLLAMAKVEKHVVLFTSHTEGTVLGTGTNTYSVGDTHSWWTVADRDVWEILPQGSSVELVQGVTHG